MESFFSDTFGENEPGSLSYHEVERMMLNSKILEPLYAAIPISERDEDLYFENQDWSRRNSDLKNEILKTFEVTKNRIYEAASRYRLNIRRIRHVLSELSGKTLFHSSFLGSQNSLRTFILEEITLSNSSI